MAYTFVMDSLYWEINNEGFPWRSKWIAMERMAGDLQGAGYVSHWARAELQPYLIDGNSEVCLLYLNGGLSNARAVMNHMTGIWQQDKALIMDVVTGASQWIYR